jgi:hypothetical protein
MLSNHGAEAAVIDMEVFHLRKDGVCLGYWSRKLRPEAEDLVEAFRLKDLYGEVNERTEEIIYVCASINGKLVADDMLFFCSYVEYSGEYKPLAVKTEKTGGGRWRIHLEAKRPVRMVELESNQKLLYSDDYFPLIPEKAKVIDVSLLEKTSNKPVNLTVAILGFNKTQSFVLN